MDSKALFVVAIDFGTTYSGYAYCSRDDYEQDPPKIFAYEKWIAARQAVVSKKTTTCLLLTPKKEFHAFGYEAEDAYIDLAIDNKHKDWYYFKRFKMKLHGDNEDINDDMMIEDELRKPVNAIMVFSESIKYLKNHFLSQLRRTGIDIKEKEIRWVLTVPAIWSDSAKAFMRKAAVKAGIKSNQLKIALESEAASIYCRHMKTERSKSDGFTASGVGTKYMVIDIGGGTTDITVHEKLKDGKLKELKKASGGAWGGTAIDQHYFQLLTMIVGGPVMNSFQHTETSEYCEMMREFEVSKRTVTLNESEDTKQTASRKTINVRVPAPLDKICEQLNKEDIKSITSSDNFPYKDKIRKVSNKLLIDIEIMQELFKKVISQITDHVEKMLKEDALGGVSLIILAGGCSESELVQDVFINQFKTEKRRVIVSGEASLSVLKGAVLFGHKPGEIQSRIIRYTYGIRMREPFDPAKHPESKKTIDKGKEYCSRIFEVFIRQGLAVDKGHRITKHYRTDKQDNKLSVYSSSKSDPRYVDEKGVTRIKNIRIPPQIPKSSQEEYHLMVTYILGDTEVEMEIKDKDSDFVFNDTFDYACD